MKIRSAKALAAILLLLCVVRPLQAGGSTSHLAQASYALQFVQDPVLKAKLEAHLNAYLNGANFPDTFNVTALPAPYLPALSFVSSGDAHSAHFLSTYAAYLEDHPGLGSDLRLAHFMGSLAHIVGDQRFDRYFLTRVTRQCWPEDYVGRNPAYAQVFTDMDLDWLLSPLRDLPETGIHTPYLPFVPWAVGHTSPLFVPPSIFELAFPNRTPISYAYLSLGVAAGWGYIDNERAFIQDSFAGYGPLQAECDYQDNSWGSGLCYAENTWLAGIGGAVDGGRAIAAYMDRAWAIMQAGGLPHFEDYGNWPNNELRLRDARAAAPVTVDYGSWIAGPQNIARFAIDDRRIAALTYPTAGVTTLLEQRRFVEESWSPILTATAPVADFKLEEQRTGVLLDDGRLLLNSGANAQWQSTLINVSGFQMDGARTGALVKGNLLIQEGSAGWSQVELPLGAGKNPSVVAFQLDGERLGVLVAKRLDDGKIAGPQALSLHLGEGLSSDLVWHDVWREEVPGSGSGLSFRLDGERVGVLVDGELSTHEGPLGPLVKQWTVQRTGIAEFQLKGGCAAALTHSGKLLLQRGDLVQPWQEINAGVVHFELEGYNELWPFADPWLAYTLEDHRVLTNRTAASWTGQGLPHSHEHSLPGLGVASAFALEKTSPYPAPDGIEGEIKLEDRLAVLIGNRLWVQELPHTPYTEAASAEPIRLAPFTEGLLFDRVTLLWDNYFTAGPDDYVALYDQDPNVAGPDGYIGNNWQYATNDGNWVSFATWKAGYYMAYIKVDGAGNRTITHVWGPSEVSVQELSAERGAQFLDLNFVQLNWSVQNPGSFDYVALYERDPGGEIELDGLTWDEATLTLSKPGAFASYAFLADDTFSVLGGTGTTLATYEVVAQPSEDAIVLATSIGPGADGQEDVEGLLPNERAVGPFDHVPLQWRFAKDPLVSDIDDAFVATGEFTAARQFSAGYYAAYIQQDVHGNRIVLASSEPTNSATVDGITAERGASLAGFNFVQINWDVHDPGFLDYVALYDHDPFHPAYGPNGDTDGYVALQWKYATGPLVSNEEPNGHVTGEFTAAKQYAAGYYAAYVQEDVLGNKRVLAVSEPTGVQVQYVQASRSLPAFDLNFVGLHWQVQDPGFLDFVALYDHDPSPTTDNPAGDPNGHLALQWKYAAGLHASDVNGLVTGAFVSQKQYAAGYYVAYVREDAQNNRTVVAVSQPTSSQVLSVGVGRGGLGNSFVRLNWQVQDPGFLDYVALYDRDPYVAGPDGYVGIQWKYATGPLVSDEVNGLVTGAFTSLRRYQHGYYAAYVQEDAGGNKTVLSVSQPVSTSVALISLSKQRILFLDWVALNWSSNTNPGYRDYVALYDRYPNDPNGHLVGQWQWTGRGRSSPWVSGRLWRAGFYMAYIREDARGVRTIERRWGPTGP